MTHSPPSEASLPEAVRAAYAQAAENADRLSTLRQALAALRDELRTTVSSLRRQNQKLRDIAVEALALAEDGWAHAGDYFNAKYGSGGRLAKLRTALIKMEAPPTNDPMQQANSGLTQQSEALPESFVVENCGPRVRVVRHESGDAQIQHVESCPAGRVWVSNGPPIQRAEVEDLVSALVEFDRLSKP